MSLAVSDDLLEKAKAGPVEDEAFLDCVRDSLPYAWKVVNQIAEEAKGGASYAVDRTDPPSDAEFGQLLRFFASTPMRTAAERHFGVELVFQNCCTSGAFTKEGTDTDVYRDFVSNRGQLLNQSPGLVNC